MARCESDKRSWDPFALFPKKGKEDINAKLAKLKAKESKFVPSPFSIPLLKKGASLSLSFLTSIYQLGPIYVSPLIIIHRLQSPYNLLFVSLPLNNTGLLGYGSTVMSLSGFSSLAR